MRKLDTIYDGVIWTFVEPCIGLVCGCLPTIRGLFPNLNVKERSSGSPKPKTFDRWRRLPFDGYSSQLNTIEQYHEMNSSFACKDPGQSARSQHGIIDNGQIQVSTSIEVV